MLVRQQRGQKFISSTPVPMSSDSLCKHHRVLQRGLQVNGDIQSAFLMLSQMQSGSLPCIRLRDGHMSHSLSQIPNFLFAQDRDISPRKETSQLVSPLQLVPSSRRNFHSMMLCTIELLPQADVRVRKK